jgi:hypothetical protein
MSRAGVRMVWRRYSKENVDLAAALLTLACLGEGKEISWQHEPRLRFLLGLHSVREASRRAWLLSMSNFGAAYVVLGKPSLSMQPFGMSFQCCAASWGRPTIWHGVAGAQKGGWI